MHILAVRSNLRLSLPNWQMDPRGDRLSTNYQETEDLGFSFTQVIHLYLLIKFIIMPLTNGVDCTVLSCYVRRIIV